MADTPDPATGLTKRQKDAVRGNWAKISSGWKTNGLEFFIRLFKTYPYTKKFFKAFDGMDYDQIRGSSKLRAHAINFKNGITSLVDNLDDVDCLVVLIHKMTENHFRRQIQTKQCQDALTLFTSYIQEVSEVDEFTLTAWKTTLGTVAKVLSDHMNELQKQTGRK